MAAADPPPTPPGDATDAGRQRVRVRIRERVRLPSGAAGPAPAGPVLATTGPVLDGMLVVAVLALALFLGSFAAVNADLWPHLAAGRLVASGRFQFGADPFSAAPGATWVNHAWLYDLLQYLLFRPGGAVLVAFKAGLVVVLAAVLVMLRRRGFLGPAAATTLVLLAVSPFLLLRPVVASYLFFAVLLLILQRRYGPRGRWQMPAAVGVLFLLWVNTDGGFVLGLVLLAVWLVGSLVQRGMPVGTDVDDTDPPHPTGVLAAALAAAVVASLINPYHVHAFRLPAELAPLVVPEELRRDRAFENYVRDQLLFMSPLQVERQGDQRGYPGYPETVGLPAALALYALLIGGLASFALNAGGWRWRRVLAWAAFAWLGTSYGPMIPYFALVGGPIMVLNVQAFLARRRDQRPVRSEERESEEIQQPVTSEEAGSEAKQAETQSQTPPAGPTHAQAFFAMTARVGLLIGLAVLLVLAWPGWLGPDPKSLAPVRRVAWRVVPEPTLERLCRRLAGWYAGGELPEDARGFHYQPDFSAHCAWFCPVEKGLFDLRLTAPPEVLLDYIAMRRAVFALDPTVRTGEMQPGPPEPLLTKSGITHLVLSGPVVIRPFPDYTGLGLAVFQDPDRWPLWSIDGRGVICGHGNSVPRLRIDPTRLAVGDAAAPLPPADEADRAAPPVEPVTAWDRFRAAPAPTPPEAYQAGLWTSYAAAVETRGQWALTTSQAFALIARLAPVGLPELTNSLFDPGPPLGAAWRRSPAGRAGRAAALLAVRDARRAVRANPVEPDGYQRLMFAYDRFAGDEFLTVFQRIVAARQAVARLQAVGAYRPSAAREELILLELMVNLYRQKTTVPGVSQPVPPLDMILQLRERQADLLARAGPTAIGAPPEKFEAVMKQMRAQLETDRTDVHRRRDDWEISAGNRPAPQRAAEACRLGLAAAALQALREAPPSEMVVGPVLMYASLSLLAGDAETARDLLAQVEGAGLTQLSPQQRQYVHMTAVQAAAALGDYRGAVEQTDALLDGLGPPTGLWAAQVLSDLVLADLLPDHPLSRVLTMPQWGGLWRQGQPYLVNNVPTVGDVATLYSINRERATWQVRQGLLALEAGDVALARRRLAQGAASPSRTAERTLALGWLELWPK
jgi:hypothetical protein